jgi:c-di-GMP-binding flagellar brake protein YcgR
MRRDPEAQDVVPADLLPVYERRLDARQSARQHVAIRFRNTNLICDLMDLSETGAKICVLDGVVPNVEERLVLTLFDGTEIDGRVSWLRDKSIGIEFANPVANVDERLDFEDLGSAYFGMAVALQKSTRRG